MGDIVKAIEFLGIPTTIAISIIVVYLITQFIGEFVEMCGRVVPEFFKVRKFFKRRKEEKNEMKKMILECKQIISDFNAHYDNDNISQRNNWMHSVDTSMQDIQKLDSKIDKLLDANKD